MINTFWLNTTVNRFFNITLINQLKITNKEKDHETFQTNFKNIHVLVLKAFDFVDENY